MVSQKKTWLPQLGSVNFRFMNGSRRAPIGLRSIALFEAAKGILVLAAACGLLSLRNTDLHAATDEFLLKHGINPESHYMRLFIEGVARATHHHVREIAAIGFVYVAVRFVEAFGLWREKHWAEWFAVISAGIYLPLELTHFGRNPSLFNAAVILVNMLIILYLAALLGQQRTERQQAESRRLELLKQTSKTKSAHDAGAAPLT